MPAYAWPINITRDRSIPGRFMPGRFIRGRGTSCVLITGADMETARFLFAGAFFGLVSGIAPGPLLTLVIAETVRYNRVAGIKIALSPLLTDVPIVTAAVFLLGRFSAYNAVLGAVSIAGGLFIGYLAYESITTRQVEVDTGGGGSLRRGVITNFLNPHPYVFWITVGAPKLLTARASGVTAAVLFVAGFYLLLVGSKTVIAFTADKSKRFLSQKSYVYIIRALGVALLVFMLLFIRDAVRFFRMPPGL